MSERKPESMKITFKIHSVVESNENEPEIVLKSRSENMNILAIENIEKVNMQPLNEI